MTDRFYERLVDGIFCFFIFIVFELLGFAGLDFFALLNNEAFIIGFIIVGILLLHLIPESVYEFFDKHPFITFISFFSEMFVMMLLIGLNIKYK